MLQYDFEELFVDMFHSVCPTLSCNDKLFSMTPDQRNYKNFHADILCSRLGGVPFRIAKDKRKKPFRRSRIKGNLNNSKIFKENSCKKKSTAELIRQQVTITIDSEKRE